MPTPAAASAWRTDASSARVGEARLEAGGPARELQRHRVLRAGQAADPRLGLERGEVDRILRRVVLREDEQERLAQQRVLLQPSGRSGRDVVVALGDQQVEGAGAQQRDAVLGLVLAHVAVELPVALVQLVHGRHGEPGGGAGERADHDGAGHGSVLGGELGGGGVELGEHAVGAGDQPGGGGREADAAPVALEQRDAGLALELGERLRDGGRRVADRAGDVGDRAAPRQLAQEPQSSHLEHR